MNTRRACGCTGCRSCLLCENEFYLEKINFCEEYKKRKSYVFCPDCGALFPGWEVTEILNNHDNHRNMRGLQIPGILVKANFLTEEEGRFLMESIDCLPWQISQSGRRKQNFGPKTNFKKKKLNIGDFKGFPQFSKFVQNKFREEPILQNFQTIEQCSLEYNPDRGGSIDPHIDDCWVWGERVVTVNCLSDTVLTLVRYKGDSSKYNLGLVKDYKQHLICDLLSEEELCKYDDVVIRIPMPNLSLIVMYGPARYQFQHCVLREDLPERRVCVAYREFTPMNSENGLDYELRKTVTENANLFWDNKNL